MLVNEFHITADGINECAPDVVCRSAVESTDDKEEALVPIKATAFEIQKEEDARELSHDVLIDSSFSSTVRSTASGFYGVTLDLGNSGKWRAFIDVASLGCFEIGFFDSAEAAAHAYDEVACRVEGAELNFKREMMGGGGDSTRPEEAFGFARGSQGNLKHTSKFFGVSWRKSRGIWQTKLTVVGKRVLQFDFTEEIEAAEHYDFLVSQI